MAAVGAQRKLDTGLSSKATKLLVQQFSHRVVGQSEAVQTMASILEHHRAGFGDPTRPIGNALFLGPTGTGKTHIVETFTTALFGDPRACIKIDCSEFQHSHEIAKLIGSPPGYLGHRETHPLLTQEALNQWHTAENKVSILLFDEIEKASDSLWSLLLGILDKATLTLGDNRKVNFSQAIIVMTSNLGACEMAKKDIGYGASSEEYAASVLKQKAMSAVRAKFTPEFINRLNHIVMFETLTEKQIEQILEIELDALGERIFRATFNRSDAHMFNIVVSPKAKHTLLEQGYDKTYGARHLKRAIDRLIERPLAKLLNSGQIMDGDIVVVDDSGKETFDFYSHPSPVTKVVPKLAEPVSHHVCGMHCYDSNGIRTCEKK